MKQILSDTSVYILYNKYRSTVYKCMITIQATYTVYIFTIHRLYREYNNNNNNITTTTTITTSQSQNKLGLAKFY